MRHTPSRMETTKEGTKMKIEHVRTGMEAYGVTNIFCIFHRLGALVNVWHELNMIYIHLFHTFKILQHLYVFIGGNNLLKPDKF